MDNTEYLINFEITICEAVRDFLREKEEIDTIEPEMTDIEGKWEEIAQSYMQDGVREFANYPTVSLGWMMFVGMAVATMWDDDWEKYSQQPDLYLMLRDVRGYDYMDEYVCEEVLRLSAEDAKSMSGLVRDVATIAYRILIHEAEPGTAMAYYVYMRTLHQMYRFGAAVWLKRMGYHMTKV